MKVDLYLSTQCTRIDTENQIVHLKNLDDGTESTLQYDKLIIATGSFPFKPLIKGADKPNVFTCWTLEDARKIQETAAQAKSAVVIGAGLIGMEVAEALYHMGLQVSIVEFLPDVLLAMVDSDIAKQIRTEIIPDDISVYVNSAAQSINGDPKPESVTIKDLDSEEESIIPADMVILATGVRPNTKLFQTSSIPLGATMGFPTNNRQETQIPNVYAAGDCVEYSSSYWRKPILTALGTEAVRQGKVAGINATGGSVETPKILMNRVTKLFGFEIAAVGMTSVFAEKVGVELVSLRGKASTLPDYFPGGKQIILKLLFNKATEKLYGAQIVGETQAAQRMNALILAVDTLTAKDLSIFETCYAPPIAPTWDVINVVADGVARRFEKNK